MAVTTKRNQSQPITTPAVSQTFHDLSPYLHPTLLQGASSAALWAGTSLEPWTETTPLGLAVVAPPIACAPAFFESSAARLRQASTLVEGGSYVTANEVKGINPP